MTKKTKEFRILLRCVGIFIEESSPRIVGINLICSRSSHNLCATSETVKEIPLCNAIEMLQQQIIFSTPTGAS